MPNEAKKKGALFSALFSAHLKKSEDGLRLSDANSTSYIDFIDPVTGRANLALEWLMGCRGWPSATAIQVRGPQHAGKSSLLYYFYGMALVEGCWILHNETEQAALAPQRINTIGTDPDTIKLSTPNGIPDFLEQYKNWPSETRKVDPDDKYPRIIGLDSISNLTDKEVNMATGAKDKDTPGEHARLFSKFFRDTTNFSRANNMRFICTGQFKSKIGTMPGQDKNTVLAGNPVGFGATWVFDVSIGKGDDAGTFKNVYITCKKSKMSAHSGAKLNARLFTTTDRAWDFDKTIADLLVSSYSPFAPGTYKKAGQYYYYDPINKKGNKGRVCEDFLDQIYSNEEMLKDIRNTWNVKGYDLPFEKQYREKSNA